MDGISLSWRDMPETLIERHILRERVIIRSEGAEREIRFLYRDRVPLIPAWHGNEFTVCSWGSQNRRSRLPRTGCVAKAIIESWREVNPVPVEIPAAFGLERGFWYLIRQGVRGVLVHDEWEQPHVYILTQPASHYYEVMTRSKTMPVLIGEQI